MPEPTVVEEKGWADVEAGLPRQVTAGDRDPGCQEGPPEQGLLHLKVPAGVLSDRSVVSRLC